MEKKNYDIWAFQHNPNEIYTALEGLENSEDNMLYSNCISHLQVGDTKLCVQFDTALINEDKERMIIMMKDGPLKREHFFSILAEKNIRYNEVSFPPTKQKEDENQDLKEIWFALDEEVVREALLDSRDIGIDQCTYYSNLVGFFELCYPLTGGKEALLENQVIHGAIVLEDKIVLLMDNSCVTLSRFTETSKAIIDSRMIPTIIWGYKGLPQEELPRQYKKER